MENQILVMENDDANVNELQNLENSLKLAIQNGNDDTMRAVQRSLSMCPNTLLDKLFPNKIRKVNEELLIKDMKAKYDDRRAMMQLWVDIQLELTKKRGEKLIKNYEGDLSKQAEAIQGDLSKQAMAIQADLNNFFNKKYTEFLETINKTRTHFSDQIEKQYQNLESHKHIPFLYEREKESIENQSKMFFSTIEELQEKFKQTLADKMGAEKKDNDQ